MARRKKAPTPAMIEGAQKLAGMKSISPTLDLGNGVSVETVEAVQAEANAALEDYNATLALGDEKLNIFIAKEKAVKAINKKILPAGGLKFGTDSNEYEKLGGVRDSERAKPTRTPAPPTT